MKNEHHTTHVNKTYENVFVVNFFDASASDIGLRPSQLKNSTCKLIPKKSGLLDNNNNITHTNNT